MRPIIYKMAFGNFLTNLNAIDLMLSEAAKVSASVTQRRNNMNILAVGQGESAVDKDACRQG